MRNWRGGGFLIVPGLIGSTGMPILNAVGTSLIAVTAFGLTTDEDQDGEDRGERAARTEALRDARADQAADNSTGGPLMLAVDRGLAVLCIVVFLGLTTLAGRFRFPRAAKTVVSVPPVPRRFAMRVPIKPPTTPPAMNTKARA
jgi:hypothetical protein